MTEEEYNELKQHVELLAQQDFHLGRALHLMLRHLGAAHGVGPAAEVAAEPVPEEEEEPAPTPLPRSRRT